MSSRNEPLCHMPTLPAPPHTHTLDDEGAPAPTNRACCRPIERVASYQTRRERPATVSCRVCKGRNAKLHARCTRHRMLTSSPLFRAASRRRYSRARRTRTACTSAGASRAYATRCCNSTTAGDATWTVISMPPGRNYPTPNEPRSCVSEAAKGVCVKTWL